MIERTILKEKLPLERLKAVLGNHSDWEYVVSERHAAWHIRIDKGGETFDAELLEHEAYPDPRVAYLVEVTHIDAGKVKVRRGSHERVLNASTSKQVGEKAVLLFLEGDRSKPFIIG